MKKLIVAIMTCVVLLVSTGSSYGHSNPGNSEHHPITVEEGGVLTQNTTELNTGTELNTAITINENIATPTDLLSPNVCMPLAKVLPHDDTFNTFYLTKSIFKNKKTIYTTKELTQFANPGKFLGVFWPEWSNSYTIEIATYAKYKSSKSIALHKTNGPFPCVITSTDLVKIGEANGYAVKLNKSENQVVAALAVQAAKAGATLVVYRIASNPLVKVGSFVLGGGGLQTGNSTSIFNGATGIGSSTSEKLTRAFVVAELYR